ncbi:hypothetical protein R6Y95_05550 [Methanoculleus palmolei]|uniref:Uncharacterized protein n=1 Tax=Methanoculleus palmolei TaxID=72612 RepID=A0ABD8A5V2_9EURY|nr:hypothetical protein R6Y95_05550 [Methanoculleus palmolei]
MGEGVTVPVITSIQPAYDCIVDTIESFFDRLFEIVIDVASTVTVWVNDIVAFAVSTYETFVSWLFDSATTVVEMGVNIIRIVVANTAGSTEGIIHAVITETPVTSAPEITSTIPPEQSISNVLGGTDIRTFRATVDQPATVIFSVDGWEKRRFNAVTSATWECNFSGYSAGIHGVVVTASNSNGSDSFTWSWEILEKPVITFVTPSAENVSNYDTDGKRIFSASVNIPCLLELYLNDRLLEKSPSEDTAISQEFKLVSFGIHTVKVMAKKSGVEVERSWNWNVTEYSDPDIIYCESQYYSGLRSLRAGNVPITIERYLNFYSNSEIRYQKAQLPDGSWIYLFALSNVGLVVDNDLQLPPIVIDAELFQDDIYLGGFTGIELSINETFGNDNFVLFSSIDRFCVGISPLKGGNLENYYKERADLENLVRLVSFLPYVGTFTNLAAIMSPKNYLSEIESINYSFGYEATMESDGILPTGGRSPYVENQFRWVVWVQPECCVKFRVTMKLIETYVESFETSQDIQITAGENPVVL